MDQKEELIEQIKVFSEDNKDLQNKAALFGSLGLSSDLFNSYNESAKILREYENKVKKI